MPKLGNKSRARLTVASAECQDCARFANPAAASRILLVVKFLVLIRHGLYLRNYESVLRALARAGHRVEIAVTNEKTVDATLLDNLPAEHPEIAIVTTPERTGWWWAANDPLRAARDYLRYLDPAYRSAPMLVERGSRRIPPGIRLVFEKFPPARAAIVRRALTGVLDLIERSAPSDPGLVEWVAARRPDAVLVTPLVDFNYFQLDALKAARALGIPTALLVASWDNLTNKGAIQIVPDLVTVWNRIQQREAETMHRVPAERIVATGAQLYDHWFAMRPGSTRTEFCARLGNLDPARPIILYLCSSAFICPEEVGIVRRWLAAVRGHSDPLLRSANVVVRPHPAHGAQWSGVSLAEFGNAVIWPPVGAAPLDQERKQEYFDNLFHAACVVGVNTSGFLEASIIGRRTLTFRSPEFPQSQDGTLHFRYLAAAGVVAVSDEIAAHLAQLADVLHGRDAPEAQVRRFVEDFLRPNGLDVPCTPILVAALEQLAAQGRRKPLAPPVTGPLIRALTIPLAMQVRRMYLARLSQRPERRKVAAAAVAAKGEGEEVRAKL
jgi:hypothetical protein